MKDRIEIPQSVFVKYFTTNQYQKYKQILHKFRFILTSHPDGYIIFVTILCEEMLIKGKPKEQHITTEMPTI
jgi:hypothetical protein